MKTHAKRILKKVHGWGRTVRLLVFFSVFLIVSGLSYLYFHGLPGLWKQAATEALARRGVFLELESLHWDPVRGLIARNVSFRQSNEYPMTVHLAEVSLNIDLMDIFRRRFALDRVEFDGSDIQLGFANDPSTLLIRRTHGAVCFLGNGIIDLQRVTGSFFGILLEISGKLDLSRVNPNSIEKRNSKTDPVVSNYNIKQFVSYLGELRSGTPIEIRLQIDGNVNHPAQLVASGEIEGKQLSYNHWQADQIQGKFSFESGVLNLSQFQVSVADGKTMLAGTWDAISGEVHFELNSDLSPNVLLNSQHSGSKSIWDHMGFGKHPQIWVRGMFNARQTPPWKSMVAEGSVWIKDASWREVEVHEIRANLQMRYGVLEIPSILLRQEFGTLTGYISYELGKQTAVFDVESTLDLSQIMQWLYPGKRNWFYGVHFRHPPLVKLTGSWAIRDPNGLNARGSLDWNDWTSNEIEVRSTQADMDIHGRVFAFKNLKLIRPEGDARGQFTLDFMRQVAHLDLTSSLDFRSLARMVSLKLENTMNPYQFLTPPTIVWKGDISLDETGRNQLTTQIKCGRFKTWRFNAEDVSATVRYMGLGLEVAQYNSRFYDGRLTGNVVFDLSKPDPEWSFYLNADQVDFAKMSQDLWNYREVKGVLTGSAHVHGTMNSDKNCRGKGEVRLSDGVIWKIPLFGELSKFIPILGVQKATKGTAQFTISDRKAHIDDMKISAGIMSLTAKGDYSFDQSLDMIVHGHFLRGLFGVGYVLDPLTKAFEYHLGGKLTARKWRPRFLPKELLLQFGDENSTSESESRKQDSSSDEKS